MSSLKFVVVFCLHLLTITYGELREEKLWKFKQQDALNVRVPLRIGRILRPAADPWNPVGEYQKQLARSLNPEPGFLQNNRCREHFEAYFKGVRDFKPFATALLDSTGKNVPPGDFNTWNLGMYGECVAVRASNLTTADNKSLEEFRGKYCLLLEYWGGFKGSDSTPQQLKQRLEKGHTTSMGFQYLLGYYQFRGSCVPSSCQHYDLDQAWAKTLDSNPAVIPGVVVVSVGCSTDEAPAYGAGEIGFLTFLAATSFLILAATCVDLYYSYHGIETSVTFSKKKRSLLAFSMYTNGRKLLSTKTSKDSVSCLNGIRVISMGWIILGHTYGQYNDVGTTNPYQNMLMFEDLITSVVLAAQLAVDTFFFLSGFLVSYLLLKEMSKRHGRFNVILYYLHRYIRLTPALMVTIWFLATSLQRVASGPFWPWYEGEPKACQTRWWENLLYIQNFRLKTESETTAECFPLSWYLAVDMQLYWVAPLMIAPLYFRPLIGLAFLTLLTLGSVAYRIAVLYINDYYGILNAYSSYVDFLWLQQYADLYVKPWARAGPYIIGIMSAHFVIERRKRQTKTDFSFKALLGWTLSILCLLLLIFLPYPWQAIDAEPINIHFSRIFYATFRTIWGCCLAWIVLACEFGIAGPVNTILSWKPFSPLSRLTYCAYLIHILIANVLSMSQTQVHDSSHIRNWFNFFGVWVLTYLLAVVLNLWYESPILNLEKVLLGKSFSDQKKTTETKDFVPELKNDLAKDLAADP